MRRRNSISRLRLIAFGTPLAVILLFLYFYFIGFRRDFISPIPAYKSFVLSVLGKKTDVEGVKNLLSKNNIKFDSVGVSDSSIIIKLKGGEEIFISSEKSKEQQISSLQLIIARITIEGKRFSRLDLRFDKPVIVFK